jgi:hypothetical protein
MEDERFIGGLRILPEGTTTPRTVFGFPLSGGTSNVTRPLAELLRASGQRSAIF